MRKQARIPIVFEEEKTSTKAKLAKLLKKYHASMNYNENENTYEVDVEVKFSSVGEKMQFMDNYLKKDKREAVLEEQQPNYASNHLSEQSSQYLTHIIDGKPLIGLSSIKKQREPLENINQSLDLSATPKPPCLHEQETVRKLQLEIQEPSSMSWEQLALRLEQAIDRSCEEILLRKIRPDLVQHQHKSAPKEDLRFMSHQKSSRDDYSIFAFSGKSKSEVAEQINGGILQSESKKSGVNLLDNILIEERAEEERMEEERVEEEEASTHFYTKSGYQKNQVVIHNLPKSEASNNVTSIKEVSNKKHNTEKPNPSHYRVAEHKPHPSSHSSKPSSHSSKPSSHSKPNNQSSKGNKISYSSYISQSINGLKSNKQQHEQFKKFLDSHRQKLDHIVSSYDSHDLQSDMSVDSNSGVPEEESMDESVGGEKDFSTRMIEEYKERMLVDGKNLNTGESVRYFRFLIKHAKSLYLEFLRRGKK